MLDIIPEQQMLEIPEILLCIFDNFRLICFEENKKTLTRCLLVNSLWFGASSQILWRHISTRELGKVSTRQRQQVYANCINTLHVRFDRDTLIYALQFPMLRVLRLDRDQIWDWPNLDANDWVAKFLSPNLRELYLYKSIDSELLDTLSLKCPRLEKLQLKYDKFGDSKRWDAGIVAKFLLNSKTSKLYIEGLNDNSYPHFQGVFMSVAKAKNVEELSIDHLPDRCVREWYGLRFTHLKKFSCTREMLHGKALLQFMPNLTHFTFSKDKMLEYHHRGVIPSDLTIGDFISHPTSMVEIVTGLTKEELKDEDLIALARKHPNLERLELKRWHLGGSAMRSNGFTYSSLRHPIERFTAYLPQLKHLHLDVAREPLLVGARNLVSVGMNCRRLETLTLQREVPREIQGNEQPHLNIAEDIILFPSLESIVPENALARLTKAQRDRHFPVLDKYNLCSLEPHYHTPLR